MHDGAQLMPNTVQVLQKNKHKMTTIKFIS